MSKIITRLITLIVVVAMVASLAVGCSGTASNPSGSGDNERPSGISEDVNIEDLRGTTVIYATWKDPGKNEDGPVVEAFEEKYGINVEVQLLDQMDYVNLIAASIAANKQADIFFENDSFPASLTVMQPLDAAKLDLTDPIWNQRVIEYSTFEGHPYLVDMVGDIWTDLDICVYNKTLLENNNIRTPQDYIDQDKWTFQNFRKIAEEVSKLGKGYIGATSHGGLLMSASGNNFFKYEDSKFTVSVNEELVNVMTFLAQMKTDGLLQVDYTAFQDGKVGMAITNSFALKKTGYYPNINPDCMGFAVLPKWGDDGEQLYPSTYRGWGLIKGAKNPVGAGLFLREYLDINNYDTTAAFHSGEAASFFYKLINENYDKAIYYHESGVHKVSLKGYQYQQHCWSNVAPTQIKSFIDGQKNIMQDCVDDCNAIFDTESRWLKENGFN